MISRVCELRSNADADRYVGAFFLAISNIGVGADFQAAFNGGVLVELEDHSLGTGQVLLEVLSFTGGLRLSTVRVKEFFSTEAIFPDTDCSCAAAWLFDKLRSAASWVVGGEKAQTATTRVRPARMVKNTRPTFLIFEPSSDFRPSLDRCAVDLPRQARNVNNPISSTEY